MMKNISVKYSPDKKTTVVKENIRGNLLVKINSIKRIKRI